MALSSHLIDLGFGSRQSDFLGITTASSLSGTGITQADGTPITANVNRFTTISAGVNDSATLPLLNSFKGSWIMIRNDSADTMQVFPGSGDSIDNNLPNAAITIAGPGAYILFRVDTTVWVSR